MSPNSVSPIRRQARYKKLAKSYPRAVRSNTELLPDYIDPQVRSTYPPETDPKYGHIVDTFVPVFTLREPNPESIFLFEYDTADLGFHNTLLAYRMLKELYGDPDTLALYCYVEQHALTPMPTGRDWGYLLKVDEHLFAEVRSVLHNARLVIRFWLDHETQENEREAIVNKASKFLVDYEGSIEKNAELFSEELDLPKDRLSAACGVINVFAQNYRAAEALLEMADSVASPSPERYVPWEQTSKVNTHGSLYVSSAIQFFSALEALINTIMSLKIKDEFRADHYERITIRADLDVRLMTAHLFCEGFEKQVVAPKTDLWKRLLKLRDFRNAVVHGNVTPEHHIFTLIEDANNFLYKPSFDFRGRKREAADSGKYPTTMSGVNSGTVNDIKDTVDSVVSAILEALDCETKDWLGKWLWHPFVLRDAAKLMHIVQTSAT